MPLTAFVMNIHFYMIFFLKHLFYIQFFLVEMQQSSFQKQIACSTIINDLDYLMLIIIYYII